MFGRHVEIAITQGQNEITWPSQATEPAKVATKNSAFTKGRGSVLPERASLTSSERFRRYLRELKMTQSPLDCFEAANVARPERYPDARRIRG